MTHKGRTVVQLTGGKDEEAGGWVRGGGVTRGCSEGSLSILCLLEGGQYQKRQDYKWQTQHGRVRHSTSLRPIQFSSLLSSKRTTEGWLSPNKNTIIIMLRFLFGIHTLTRRETRHRNIALKSTEEKIAVGDGETWPKRVSWGLCCTAKHPFNRATMRLFCDRTLSINSLQ